MAQIVFIEINDSNIIVGVHSHEPESKFVPPTHSIQEATVEDPQGLLGLPSTDIDTPPESRTKIGEPTLKENQRAELKRMSIELDLMEKLEEDTTALQAEFDALETAYNALP